MRKTYVVLVLAVVLSLSALPALARAVECPDPAVLDDPQALSTYWQSSLSSFADAHPDLSVEKLALLVEGFDLGVARAFAVSDQGRRWYTEHGQAMQRWVERMEEAFTSPELGEIFTGMGPVQLWMVQAGVQATPLCNCQTIDGPCTFSGGPTGICKTGCKSWTGEDGGHRVGLCMALEPE